MKNDHLLLIRAEAYIGLAGAANNALAIAVFALFLLCRDQSRLTGDTLPTAIFSDVGVGPKDLSVFERNTLPSP